MIIFAYFKEMGVIIKKLKFLNFFIESYMYGKWLCIGLGIIRLIIWGSS